MRSHRVPSLSRRRATSFTSSHVAGRVYSVTARPLDDGLDRPAQAIRVHLGAVGVEKDPLGRAGDVASHRGERLPRACRRWLTQRRRAPFADDLKKLLASQRVANHGGRLALAIRSRSNVPAGFPRWLTAATTALTRLIWS